MTKLQIHTPSDFDESHTGDLEDAAEKALALLRASLIKAFPLVSDLKIDEFIEQNVVIHAVQDLEADGLNDNQASFDIRLALNSPMSQE